MTSARSGGLSLKTLLIAGAASADRRVRRSRCSGSPGTVFAAAMTPIIVAVVTEVLRRPVDTVSAVRVAPHRRRHADPSSRRAGSRGAVRPARPAAAEDARGAAADADDAAAPSTSRAAG